MIVVFAAGIVVSFSLLAQSQEWHTSTSYRYDRRIPTREHLATEPGTSNGGVDTSDRPRRLREKQSSATVALQQIVTKSAFPKHHVKRPQKEVDPQSEAWDNSVAVCAIMKQEKLSDIREWLLYHQCAPPHA